METEEHKSRLVHHTHTSPFTSNQKAESCCEETEEEASDHICNRKQQNVSHDNIHTKKVDISQESVRFKLPPLPTTAPKRVNFLAKSTSCDMKLYEPAGPSSVRARSPFRNLIPKFGFIYRSSSDVEKALSSNGELPLTIPRVKHSVSRTSPVTKILPSNIKRAASLPVDQDDTNPDLFHGRILAASMHSHAKQGQTRKVGSHIARSASEPLVKVTVTHKRTDSYIRVIPSPRVKACDPPMTNTATVPLNTSNDHLAESVEDDDGEDIPEEEAVCRICFIELCEGGESLKMECCCKGELALAHKECALKWFSIKGNKTCDVCKEDVRNLPVTLLRIQAVPTDEAEGARAIQIIDFRAWQEVPVLFIVSMLAYFCFLEQLLVATMGTRAVVLSLPFSCLLGLLSSMTSSTMVAKKLAWIYAAAQFTFVVIFGHVFYSLVHLRASVAILLATFVGCGITMCGSSITIEFIRWRRNNAHPTLQQIAEEVLPNYRQEVPNSRSLARPGGFPNRLPPDGQGPDNV